MAKDSKFPTLLQKKIFRITIQKNGPMRSHSWGPFFASAVSYSVSRVFVVLVLCIGGVCVICAGVIGISVSVTIAGFIVLVRH